MVLVGLGSRAREQHMATDGVDFQSAKKQKVEAMINSLTSQPYSERYHQVSEKRKLACMGSEEGIPEAHEA